MAVTIVRELPLSGTGAQKVLVTDGTLYWVVSTLGAAYDTGKPETLVFPADAEGNVTDWGEVAGGISYTREMAIEDLKGVIEGKPSMGNFKEELLDEMGGLFGLLESIGKHLEED